MAKLNPSLIFSMTRELSELHEIGQEMIEHIGSCEIVSWRFPDRAIKDIGIDLDNELFDTSEKYVLLLELIIDRLYLILNMTIEIFNLLPELSNKTIFKLPKNVCKPTGLSFGTLGTFLWKRLRILMETKDIKFSSKSSSNTTIYNLLSNSQTENMPETCLSCKTAMEMVKKLIKKLEECMNNFKLKSEVVEQRPTMEKNIINLTQYNAMQQWTEFIVTDIQNLTIFTEKKVSENNFLNESYEKIKHENAANMKKLKIIQNKCFDLEKHDKNTTSKLQIATQMKDDLLLKINKLTIDLNRYEEECKTKANKINELENKIQQIIMANESSTVNLREDYHKQIASINSEKDFWTDLYNKSKSEIEQLETNIKLQQEKQTKLEFQIQENLTKKIQKSDETIKIETENLTLIQKVEHMKSKIKQQETEFKIRIQFLEVENSELQEDIKACKEKELILIRCPDLNGPIVCDKGKRNPLEDMEQQFESNETRIKLLQDQNTNLRRTIEKMRKLSKLPGK